MAFPCEIGYNAPGLPAPDPFGRAILSSDKSTTQKKLTIDRHFQSRPGGCRSSIRICREFIFVFRPYFRFACLFEFECLFWREGRRRCRRRRRQQFRELARVAGSVGMIAEVANDLHQSLLLRGGFQETGGNSAEQSLPSQFQD